MVFDVSSQYDSKKEELVHLQNSSLAQFKCWRGITTQVHAITLSMIVGNYLLYAQGKVAEI